MATQKAKTVLVRFGGTSKDPAFEIAGKGIETPYRIDDGVRINMPANEAALDEYAAGRTFEVTDDDGKVVHTFTGVYALAATKVSHDYETIRGKYRTMLQKGITPDADAVRQAFLQPYRPGSGLPTAVMTEEAANELSKEELLDRLKKSGLLK